MSKSILVAPREIVDYVYRASRVVGADSGAASMIGRSASFASSQLGGNLSDLAEVLSERRSPVLGISHVAPLEVRAARDGRGECHFEPEVDRVTVADLAFAAFASCGRGIEITMVCGDEVDYSPDAWLSVGKAGLQIVGLRARQATMDDGLRTRVDTRRQHALRHGVAVPITSWNALSDLASSYLVSESVIDTAEST